MKKSIFEIALLFGLVFSLLTAALASETRDGISEKVIRLHVIANSDSKEDQELKLKVRDEVLKHMEKLTEGCTGINEARRVISENITLLKSAADAVCKENIKISKA